MRVTEMRPKKVISYGLDGGYGHPDHIAVTQTLVELNRNGRLSFGRPYFLSAFLMSYGGSNSSPSKALI